MGEMSPATVLAVTDNGWLLASEAEDGGVRVEKCSLSDTLLLELTSILLLGPTKGRLYFGGFGIELVPAGALLVTERELVLIADQKTPRELGEADLQNFGGIITHFPMARLADFHIIHDLAFLLSKCTQGTAEKNWRSCFRRVMKEQYHRR
jgi:hypothetical protein